MTKKHLQQEAVHLSFPKNNNLEWLRLIFATQVVLAHTATHIGFEIPEFISYFPGVPAFFFVSGFLIYASYVNNPGWRYFENRFLRLYPGLVFVSLGGIALSVVAHGWRDLVENPTNYLLWFAAQTTIGQAYNPQFMRDIGVGVINGSLWTLTTEILFYALIPLIIWMERRFSFAVLTLLVLSFAIYALGPHILTTLIDRDKTIYDFIGLTPIVWGWMFAMGILAVKHFENIRCWLRYAPLLIAPMIVMALFSEGLFFGSSGNRLGLAYFFCYAGLILWLAFSTPYVPLKADVSYGAYVWHMPVINLLLVLGIQNAWMAILLTFLIATISWIFVEKPALRLKRQSLKAVQ